MSKTSALRIIKRRARLEELKRVKRVTEVYGQLDFPARTTSRQSLETRVSRRERV